jgi:hypothetical protein
MRTSTDKVVVRSGTVDIISEEIPPGIRRLPQIKRIRRDPLLGDEIEIRADLIIAIVKEKDADSSASKATNPPIVVDGMILPVCSQVFPLSKERILVRPKKFASDVIKTTTLHVPEPGANSNSTLSSTSLTPPFLREGEMTSNSISGLAL